MRSTIWSLVLLLAVAPAWADTGSGPSAKPSDDDLRRQRAELEARPLSTFVWRVNDDGSVLHLPSGLVCPAKANGYERARPATFDGAGLDVGCDYESPLNYSVTLYLTLRHGQSLDDDLARAQAEVMRFHPDFTLLPASNEGALDDDANWKRVMYSGSKGSLHSGIWIRDLNGWTMEFRGSYAPLAAGEAAAVMNVLAKQAVDTAAARLAACAAAAPVERTGTEVTDSDTVMMMTLIAAASDAAEDSPQKPLAADWCIEPVAADIGPAAFWRNIASDNHNGPVDRLTVPGQTDQQEIVIAGAPLVAIVANTGARANKPLTHVAALTQGRRVFLLALYDGRPSAADVFAMARDVLTGKRKPLASRDLDSKKIDIVLPAK